MPYKIFKLGSDCVTCPICDVQLPRLYAHVTQHGLTTKEFKTTYPNARLAPECKLKENHWTEEQTKYLTQWYGHWGSNIIGKELSIDRVSVKRKADKLNLRLFPRTERLCYRCRSSFLEPETQEFGILCKTCCRIEKGESRRRRIQKNPLLQNVREAYSRMKQRNIKFGFGFPNFDYTYLLELWHGQNGKCYYTGLKMICGAGTMGKSPLAMTTDRIDSSKGYSKDNIVLACWWANCAKNDLPSEQFVAMCLAVIKNTNEPN